jgi:toxin ParE1/3/4
VAHSVVFSPEARDDLLRIYEHIAGRSGAERALAYTERIARHCMGFADLPERGRRRDDLRPGLRVTGYERRVAIAFHIAERTVVIDRILYGGRDLNVAFETGEDDG